MGWLFLFYFFLEVVVTIEVGSYLGGIGVFLEIVGSFFVAIFILKNFQYGILSSISALREGNINQEQFVSMNIFSLIGAFLLMFPGILCDIIGLLMQLNFVGMILASKVKFKGNIKTNNYTYEYKNYDTNNDIIDVEVIEKKDLLEKKD